MTSGEFSENDIVWSRDGSKIYFTSNRVREPYYEPPHDEIYAVKCAQAARSRKLPAIDGPIRGISLSPDGRRIAFVGSLIDRQRRAPAILQPAGSVRHSSSKPGATPRNLTADYDYDIAGGVGGDQAPPRGTGPSKPYLEQPMDAVHSSTSAEEGRANLKRIDAETGKVEAVTDGDHDVFAYNATPDGSKAAILISTPTNIGDLYLLDVRVRQDATA